MESFVQVLSNTFPDVLSLPADPIFKESITSYFSAQESSVVPAAVLKPNNSAQVAEIIALLSKSNDDGKPVKFAVRSGGHAAFAGAANESGGITIDLRNINEINVSQDKKSVKIGTGASWGEVYRTLDPLGLCVPGGRHSQVGVGGLTLGGGLSHFSGEVGLVCDNVLAYEIVLASGNIITLRADSPEHKDLLDALRGGSNNFGIVIKFTFRTFEHGRMWGGTLIHDISTKDKQIEAFTNFAGAKDYDPNASLITSFGMSGRQGLGCVNSIVYTNPTAEPEPFKPFVKIDPVYMNTLRELSLTELTQEQDAFNKNGLCQLMISTTTFLSLPVLQKIYGVWHKSISTVQSTQGIVWSLTFQCISPSVIAKSPFLQNAIPNLKPTVSTPAVVIAQLTGTWENQNDTKMIEGEGEKFIVEADKVIAEAGTDTGYQYLNYCHAGQDVFGRGSERHNTLQCVSRKYDPNGLFQRCLRGGFKLID